MQTTLLGLAIAFIIALVAALVGPYFIDWNQFRPWIVVIEATLPNSQIECHEEWEEIITSAGYLFAYADGLVWLRTDERPPAPDAQGVRRRTARERDPDWLRNLAVEPRCRIRVGATTLEARYEPSPEPRADLERVVGLLREKYGADWVPDWYVDRGRVPVRLRPAK